MFPHVSCVFWLRNLLKSKPLIFIFIYTHYKRAHGEVKTRRQIKTESKAQNVKMNQHNKERKSTNTTNKSAKNMIKNTTADLLTMK